MKDSDNQNPESIAQFWAWFSSKKDVIESMIKRSDASGLSQLLSPRLDRVMPGLAWEVGPGKIRPYMLTISSEGNHAQRRHVETIIRKAPDIGDWEFYSSRQPRNIQSEIELVSDGIRLSTDTWRFEASEDPARRRLDITVIDERLARLKDKLALKAIFVFLDSALGEDNVEAWIGGIQVRRKPAGCEPAYTIREFVTQVRSFAERCRYSAPTN